MPTLRKTTALWLRPESIVANPAPAMACRQRQADLFVNEGVVPENWWAKRQQISRHRNNLPAHTAEELCEISRAKATTLLTSLRKHGFAENAPSYVGVRVDAHGRLHMTDQGSHRYVLCKSLGIPVYVQVDERAPEWERFRKVAGSWTRQKLFYSTPPHPDLIDLPHRANLTRVKTIAEVVAPRSRVLDLGTNVGTQAHYLSAAGHDVTGIDLDPKLHSMAAKLKRALNDQWDLIYGDLLDLPDWNCDVLIALNLFRYVHRDQRFAGLLRNSDIGKICMAWNHRSDRMEDKTEEQWVNQMAQVAGRTKIKKLPNHIWVLE